jgi:hypothetical protein
MFGVLPKNLLVVMSIMLVLWMVIVASHGFISSNENLMCFKYFFSFNNMLNVSWVERLFMFNLTGGVNIIALINFSMILASLIEFHAHTHINKMALLNANIGTLLKQG